MHIPDGYLSPETCAVALAVAVPAVAVASRQVFRQVRGRSIPKLAMLSAFSFLIMMFNLPVPGGTSAHAVGSVLIAIAMGPAAAVVATSVALLFQALVFGDGGVLAYGANVVNMAVIMPLVGLATYRLIARGAEPRSLRRVLAAAVGGYVGITVAGVAVGIELGIQPALFTDAAGTPLYNPYPLSVAVPAMLVAHLLIAGPAEAIVSGAGQAFLARLGEFDDVAAAKAPHRRLLGSPGLISLGVLAVMLLLTPLGLITQGTAFGEWGGDELAELFGSVPAGFQHWADFWTSSLLPDYGFTSGENAVVGYWVSALIGSLLVAGFTFGVVALANRLRRGRDLVAERL